MKLKRGLAKKDTPYKISELDFSRAEGMSVEQLRKCIADLEAYMKTGEVMEIPIEHHFSSGGSGVYAREMRVPGGTLLVGKIHKFENMNIISKGEVSILSIDGVKRVKAPHTFVSQPGAKRVILAHSDTVWTTIHGTNEKDHEVIEEQFIAENYDELGNIEHKGAKWLG